MFYDKAFEQYCQEITLEYLKDDKFEFTRRKFEAFRLAHFYELAGYKDLAIRAAVCCSALQYWGAEQPETGEIVRDLKWGNFCQLRLCPLCMARRAKSASFKLSKIMDLVEAEHGCKFIFLTLTVRNVWTEDELEQTLSLLTAAWHRLLMQRPVARVVHGYFRALEITRRIGDQDKGYHPHIHAILAVDREYFDEYRGYMDKMEWVERWAKALVVPYGPSVYVCKAHDRTGGKGVAFEAAKYVVKRNQYIGAGLTDAEAVERVRDYTEALYHRRLTGMGGWFKEAALELGTPDLDKADLIHIDDDYIRADVATMVEDYRWSFGAGDYILTDRRMVNLDWGN